VRRGLGADVAGGESGRLGTKVVGVKRAMRIAWLNQLSWGCQTCWRG